MNVTGRPKGRPDRFRPLCHAPPAWIRRVVDSCDDSQGSAAVAPDDLNTPLGLGKGKRLPKLPVSAPQILAGVLGLSGLVVVAWATFVHDPLGGQPVAVVATKLSLPPGGAGSRQDHQVRGARQRGRWRCHQSRRGAASRIEDGHHYRWLELSAAAGHHSGQQRRQRIKDPVRSEIARGHASWRNPESWPGRNAPVGALCTAARATAEQEGFADHRHRDRWARHKRVGNRRR